MYRILIVDDELRHRNGLAKLITEVYPSYILFEAKNGQEALGVIESEKIDIIITDIKMPIMSGIELLEQIVKMKTKVKTVMLSAYGEFEYAQKAIQLGAFDYILKPINTVQVTDVLRKVTNIIHHEKLLELKISNQERNLELSLPIYMDNLLSKWVRNMTNSSEDEEVASIIPPSKRAVILITYIEDLECKLMSQEAYGNDLKYDIKKILRESIKQIGKCISFYDSYKSHQISSIIIMDDESIESIEDKKPLFIHWANKFQNTLGLKAYMCFSDIEDLHVTDRLMIYKKTEAALENRFYTSDVIFFKHEVYFVKYLHCNRYEEEEKIEQAILNVDRNTLILEIQHLFDKMINNALPYPADLKNAIFMIFRNVMMNLNMGLFDEYEKKMINKLEITINHSKSYGQLNNEVVNIMLEFLKDIHEFKDQKDQLIFNQVLAFIKENYDKDISLEEMADKVYLSAPYFSKVFKSISGMTFTKYVQNVRLTKAKELLITTHDKIYKIANKVGYNDSKYFNRVFRNEIGITPKEYRHLSINSIDIGGGR